MNETKNKRTVADMISSTAIVLCISSVTVAAATHGHIAPRIFCVVSALLSIVGIVLKLRERGKSDV